MKKILLGFFLIVFLFLIPGFVFGECQYGDPPKTCPDCPERGGLVPCGRSCDDLDTSECECEPCTLCHLFVMLDRWIDSLLFIFVPITAALMIAIGGGMYIISRGDPEMLGRAKKLFTAVVIGLVIIYGAWLIVNLFLTVIGATVWQGPGQGWWIIDCSTKTTPSITTPPPSAPPSAPPSTPPSAQIAACNLCPGNLSGKCDQTACEDAPVGCKYINITNVDGKPGGICVVPNNCGACGSGTVLGLNCDQSQCSQIGSSCIYIPLAFQSDNGVCISPNDCNKCPIGCTKTQCESIGNCNFIPAIPPMSSSCMP